MKDFPDEKGPMYTWRKVEIMPNADKLLKTLSQQTDCYIATNAKDSSKADIIKALERVNLNKYFKDVFCYNEIGFSKPSKEYFDYVVEKLNVDRSQITMVGDDYEKDYQGAKKNGISALIYTSNSGISNNSIKSVNNLIEILDY